MIYGTHNSGTCYNLVWWERILAWPLHTTSRCQKRTIAQQLEDGIKVFNLQITKYRNKWVYSHGLCVYDKEIKEDIALFHKYATPDHPIYVTIYLDKNFLTGQDIEGFKDLIQELVDNWKDSNVILLNAWIEGTNDYIYESDTYIDLVEHYWTIIWGKQSSKWIDKIPLPKRHAKKYNKVYKESNTHKYLMLDFYEI